MSKLITTLFGVKRKDPPPITASGLYHYLKEADGAFVRFHLRVEPDHRGLLLANATAAARLSPSGVVMAKGILEDRPDDEILAEVLKGFTGASRQTAQADLGKVRAVIGHLATPDDNYPIINLEDSEFSPYEAQMMAPLRADLTLAEPEKIRPLLESLWQAGIPHATFIAPMEPNPDYLVRAVERAEDLGLIAGVRARGTDLVKGTLLADLIQAGVDHVTLPVVSFDPLIHNAFFGEGDQHAARLAIEKIFSREVCPVAETVLLEDTVDELEKTLAYITGLGVTNVSFFAVAAKDDVPEEEADGALRALGLPQAAALVEEASHQSNVRFLWQPPVQRRPEVTLAQQVLAGPRASGDVSIRVEPDGSVIPPRGPYKSAGNLLTDGWEAIWQNEAFRIYRERVEAPTRCDTCPGLAVCAADCPREPSGWALAGRD